MSNLVFHLGHFNNIQARIYHISSIFIKSTIGACVWTLLFDILLFCYNKNVTSV